MKETELNKVLNYMKQYVENKYEHDSEPMLTWKDLKLVLNEIDRLNETIEELNNKEEEIERLNNIINELEKWLEEEKDRLARETSNIYEDSLGKIRLVNEDIFNEVTKIKSKLQELKGE